MSEDKKANQNSKAEDDLVKAVVTEALPNAMFKVKLEDVEPEKEILAYLAGKMRMHRIKVLIGDTVLVKLDEFGERGRITRRM